MRWEYRGADDDDPSVYRCDGCGMETDDAVEMVHRSDPDGPVLPVCLDCRSRYVEAGWERIDMTAAEAAAWRAGART